MNTPIAKLELQDNKLPQMDSSSRWEHRARIGTFFASCTSALSIVIGGIVGIYTYHEQALRQSSIRADELKFRKYNDARDMYFELINSAAAVGAATSRVEAQEKFSAYTTIYFGKAHVYVIDDAVYDAKKEFYYKTKDLIATEEFPSRKISLIGYELAKRCRESLEKMQKLQQ